MPSYTTGRKTHWPYILRQLSVPAGIYLLIIIYDLASPNIFIKDIYYWTGLVVILAGFLQLAARKRVYKIVIDENDKTIAQYYRSLLAGAGEKIYTLSKMRLYTKNRSTASTAGTTTRSLILYKDHREILRLDRNKDGFTSQTLQEIREMLIQLGAQT